MQTYDCYSKVEMHESPKMRESPKMHDSPKIYLTTVLLNLPQNTISCIHIQNPWWNFTLKTMSPKDTIMSNNCQHFKKGSWL